MPLQVSDVLSARLPPPGYIAPGASCTMTLVFTPKVGPGHIGLCKIPRDSRHRAGTSIRLLACIAIHAWMH